MMLPSDERFSPPAGLHQSRIIMSSHRSSRRNFLKASSLALAGAALQQYGEPSLARQPAADLPPVRTITRGPKHHWFGYYDKLEFDPTSRYVLGMEVGFEHRSPKPDDEIAVGMVDLQEGDRWIELGSSTAWCWQQGCMLQWIPGSKTKVIWNDREKSQYVSRILDVSSGELHTVPHPIYALHPSGKAAIATDFRRLGDVRPGYGYNGIVDPNQRMLAPEDSGIFAVELIVSVASVAALGPMLPSMRGAKHWFNHLLFNPDGSRFVFLHRWAAGPSRETRMITANRDGTGLRVLDANGLTSHFIWRDPTHILAWSNQPSHGKAFYLFEDRDAGKIDVVGRGDMTQDGHCTYLPGNEWIVNDSYPDKDRLQHPYLYHVATSRLVLLGHFRSPLEYTGEWRCDTHPRHSPDGRFVVVDSPHNGHGRQLHLIDVSGIVGARG
jgi:hypothetical protein